MMGSPGPSPSPPSSTQSSHTPRSARQQCSTPERRTGLRGGSGLYSGGKPYREPLNASDQKRHDDNYLLPDDGSECMVCLEPLHPFELALCGHPRHSNILLDCCLCNNYLGPDDPHDLAGPQVRGKRNDILPETPRLLTQYRRLSSNTPSTSSGHSGRSRSAHLPHIDHELVRTPDVYVARSTLNLSSTAKQSGRRGFRKRWMGSLRGQELEEG